MGEFYEIFSMLTDDPEVREMGVRLDERIQKLWETAEKRKLEKTYETEITRDDYRARTEAIKDNSKAMRELALTVERNTRLR